LTIADITVNRGALIGLLEVSAEEAKAETLQQSDAQ
jgi:hypothetical protein